MNKKYILILLLVSVAGYAPAQQWAFHVNRQDPAKGYIRYDVEGDKNLAGVFLRIAGNVNVEHIFLGRIVQIKAAKLQEDLQAFYRKNAPEALNVGFASAGNLHNPALAPLENLFDEAMLSTGFVTGLIEEITRAGYRIREASHEKFFLIKENDATYFDAMVWLVLERVADKQ